MTQSAAVRKTRVPARLARNLASTSGREDSVQVRLETRTGLVGDRPEQIDYRTGSVGPSGGLRTDRPEHSNIDRWGRSPTEPELWAVPVLGKSNLIYTLIRSEGVVRIPLDSNGIAQGEWVVVELY
jgi:molybdopterin biosynthesis enzyme